MLPIYNTSVAFLTIHIVFIIIYQQDDIFYYFSQLTLKIKQPVTRPRGITS